MRAGSLRHVVTVQKPIPDTNIEWEDVLTCNAAIEPLSVREQFVASQEHASATHRIRTRYRSEIAVRDGSMRVITGASNAPDRIFVLVGLPTVVDERNREIEFLVSEGLREA